mmetsp:Transcript_14901/g.27260  ORF Transcript_14901/g.27260 Transcript_14901/m.27260 type:complete len:238 (-) Transcript_14901:74-787(-)
MYMAFIPLAFVCSAVHKLVEALTVHLIILKLAIVRDASGGGVDSMAMLAAVLEFATILGSIHPAFYTIARFLIQHPLTFVGTAIHMNILASAMGSILLPLALVCVAICCYASTVAVCFVVHKLALVALSIRSHMTAMPMSLVSKPLSSVSGLAFHYNFRSLLKLFTLGEGNCCIGQAPQILRKAAWCHICASAIKQFIGIAVLLRVCAARTAAHQEHLPRPTSVAQGTEKGARSHFQ